MNAVAKIDTHQPRSVLGAMAERYNMEPAAFEATLRGTVCPANVSREQFAAFLLVAKEHRLNPLTKEIYAFPAKGGGIQPIVGIDGWARIINEHPAFDGMEFLDERDNGELVAITCRMYRKDRSHPIEATEYMAECKRGTDVWKTWPRRMLRHKAMIQAARYAFGFSGIVDQDEYERQVEPAPTPGLAARLQASPSTGEGFSAHHAPEEPVSFVDQAEDVADADFSEPVDPPAPAEDIARDDTPADPEPEEVFGGAMFDVLAWSEDLEAKLPLYEDVDLMRADWDAKKEALKASHPERFKAVNLALLRRAAEIGAKKG